MKHTVIITGGTKGLGRETALAFARNGSFVVALYGSDRQAAAELDATFTTAGLSGISQQHDVRSENSSLWEHPEIRDAGHLTLVHNACAPFSPVPMHQLTWGDFESNHLVAVKGAWGCVQPLIRLMLKKKSGTIITVLSTVVDGIPPKGFAAYATAKHALRGLTLALASEYSSRGLKIFTVSPGYMDTGLTRQWDERLRQMIGGYPEGVTIPSAAAAKIVELATNPGTPGTGENYPL